MKEETKIKEPVEFGDFKIKDNFYGVQVKIGDTQKWCPVKRQGEIYYVTVGTKIEGNWQRIDFDEKTLQRLKYFETEKMNVSSDILAAQVHKKAAKEVNVIFLEDAAPKPFYDLDEIIAIPIEQVAEMYGVKLVRNGNSLWGAVRQEKTASTKFYTSTNTFCDFGNGNRGGNVINLVAYITGCDNESAIKTLAESFGIQPINNIREQRDFDLTNSQYEKIGVQAELATMNFDIDVEKYGIEKTMQFTDKYRMSVQQLAKEYPDTYANMLKHKAIPYVYSLRNEYYLACFNQYSLARAAGVDIFSYKEMPTELVLLAQQQTATESIMSQAAQKANINFVAGKYDVRATIEGIDAGKINIEIGNTRYAELKQAEKGTGQKLEFQRVSKTLYDQKFIHIDSIRHSAFVSIDKEKGELVNVAYSGIYKTQVQDIFKISQPERNIKR